MTPLAIDGTMLMVRLRDRLRVRLWGELSDRVWGGLWDGLRDRIWDLYGRTLTHDSDID